MVNYFLRNSVTVTLQWPQEAGAVYHVNVSPETPHTQLIFANTMTVVMINLTVSYNIQHNVSIESSLCGVATTKVLNYGKYMLESCMDYTKRLIIHLRFILPKSS